MCPHGSYLIDPDESASDNFTVVHEYGKPWLQFTETDYEKIAANRYNTRSVSLIVRSWKIVFQKILLPTNNI